MTTGKKFFELCEKLSIGRKVVTGIFKFDFFITVDEFNQLLNVTQVGQVSGGCVVLGNSHDEGGIHLLQPQLNNELKYGGEMEGFEYVSKPFAIEGIENEFKRVNKIGNLKKPTDFKPKLNTELEYDIMDMSNIETPILVMTGFQHFIFNTYSSTVMLDEILEIDNKNVP